MSRCDRWRCLDAGVPTSSQTFDNPAKELSRGNLSSCCLGTRRSLLRQSLLVVNTSMLYHHRVRCYLLFGERTPIFGFFASFYQLRGHVFRRLQRHDLASVERGGLLCSEVRFTLHELREFCCESFAVQDRGSNSWLSLVSSRSLFLCAVRVRVRTLLLFVVGFFFYNLLSLLCLFAFHSGWISALFHPIRAKGIMLSGFYVSASHRAYFHSVHSVSVRRFRSILLAPCSTR